MPKNPNEVGSAYVKVSKKTGQKFLAITLNQDVSADDGLLMFPVTEKKNPNMPDYRLIRGEQRQTTTARPATKAPVASKAPVKGGSNDSGDEGLPFI